MFFSLFTPQLTTDAFGLINEVGLFGRLSPAKARVNEKSVDAAAFSD
jgi:hypothetical protein